MPYQNIEDLNVEVTMASKKEIRSCKWSCAYMTAAHSGQSSRNFRLDTGMAGAAVCKPRFLIIQSKAELLKRSYCGGSSTKPV
jgi:hypothetical protein